MNTCYIIDAVRTPRAKRRGKYSEIHPVDLLAKPLQAICQRNKIDPASIDDLLIGCVTQVKEQGWCVARHAVLAAGWPATIPGMTINRLCAASLQAVNTANDQIKAASYDLVIAGGLEHMTRVPMFSDTGGETSLGIQEHYPNLTEQGLAAEKLADHFELSREEIDQFALLSRKRTATAQANDYYAKSLIPVEYTHSGETGTLLVDDNPRPETTLEKLGSLPSVFSDNGKLTAGNSSAIVDGAATVLLANEKQTKALHLKPRAKIIAHAVVGSDPYLQLSGPISASQKVLKVAGLKAEDIDLWEINEAFSPVVLATIKELNLNPDTVNVNGGAIHLGHPLGATGAMLIGTAIDELERRNNRYAVVTMCVGLGMGVATIIERVS